MIPEKTIIKVSFPSVEYYFDSETAWNKVPGNFRGTTSSPPFDEIRDLVSERPHFRPPSRFKVDEKQSGPDKEPDVQSDSK